MTILAVGLLVLAPQQEGQGSIWDRLEFYANGRLRGEATFDNVDGAGNEVDDRYRGRFRARLGAKYQLMDEIMVEARLSTSSDGNDANNPHWDFGDGDGFNSSNIVMDRFFFDWTASPEVHVKAGKQPNAFTTPPIFGDFLWDSDVSPSGVSAIWKPEGTDEVSFDARIAGYVATEVAADEDPKMWGGQGNVYVPVDEIKLQVSSALYDWTDNHNTAVAGNQGNSATTGGFQVWDNFVSATMAGGPLEEMTGFLEYINNLQENEKDTGWVAGVQIGPSAWKRGNYNIFAELYSLDADCLFSPVAQDDTPIAGTGIGDGMDGIVLGGQYFWRDNVAVKLWALTSDADGADDDPIRVRLDLDFNVK